ncbi:pyridoxamine 5'-phosphate oxidase family protein [Paenibacillus sp. M1]|uniref:Pyridoxamine 5'-phosphate oxidase family protein n=1 Tax=Paenibacillus haidiansis TaxID=1574488 RepID=A0ABU7VSC4_9BACL
MNQEEFSKWIKDVSIAYLATYDSGKDQPYVRPVDAGTVYNGKIYFSTFSDTDKVKQINTCHNVELTYFDAGSQLRIAGRVEFVGEQAEQERFLADNPIISNTFSGEKRKQFTLFQVIPHEVRYMGEDDSVYTAVDWKQTDSVGM